MPLVHDKRPDSAVAPRPIARAPEAPSGARARVGPGATFDEGATRLQPEPDAAPVQLTPALQLPPKPGNGGGAPAGDVEAAPPWPGVYLKKGAAGPHVKTLQRLLNRHQAALTVDGAFGQLTDTAVRNFQVGAGVAADGIVGPTTWDAVAAAPVTQAPPGGNGQGTVASGPPLGASKVVEGSNQQTTLSPPQRATLAFVVRNLAATLGAKPGGAPLGEDVQIGVTPGAVLLEWANIIEKGTPDDQMRAWFLALVALGPGGALPLVATPAQKADLLAQTAASVAAFVATSGVPAKEWQGFIQRANAMRNFYLSIAGGPDAGAHGAQKPVSGARQAMVGLALSQIGKVKAQTFQDKNDDNPPRTSRTGWRTLQMYYDVAGKNVMKGWELKTPETKLVSWCGIFATWAARASGMGSIGAWPELVFHPNLASNQVPQPGDVGNMAKDNHFGIITWVEAPKSANPTPAQIKALSIRTVEGNSGGGSEIVEKTRTVGAWDQQIRNVDLAQKKPGFSGE